MTTVHAVISTTLVLGVVIGIIIPFVSSLIATLKWPSELVGLLTVVLSFGDSFFTTWLNDTNATHYDWLQALLLGLPTLVTALLGRLIVLKNGTGKLDEKLLNARIIPFPRKTQSEPDAKAA